MNLESTKSGYFAGFFFGTLPLPNILYYLVLIQHFLDMLALYYNFISCELWFLSKNCQEYHRSVIMNASNSCASSFNLFIYQVKESSLVPAGFLTAKILQKT